LLKILTKRKLWASKCVGQAHAYWNRV